MHQKLAILLVVGLAAVDFGCGSSSSSVLTLPPSQQPPKSFELQINPTDDIVGVESERQFFATVSGHAEPAQWMIEEGALGGSISGSGLYLAPANTGIFHATATSAKDGSLRATATITVVPSGFKRTDNMTTDRVGASAVLLPNGNVLVVGGAVDSAMSATAEIFDKATETFALTGSLNTSRNGAAVTSLRNGQVLVAGGSDGTGNLLATAELFNPDSGTFSYTGSLVTARVGATATLLADGRVLIAGGFGSGTDILPRPRSTEIYDSALGTFTAGPDMSVGRVEHATTLLGDGTVLIAGGAINSVGGGESTAKAEIFDPATFAFIPVRGMTTDRTRLTLTTLNTGGALVVGGWNGHAADAADDPPWDSAVGELFVPSATGFQKTGSMSTTRIGHTSTRLADMTVLVAGGVPLVQNVHQQPDRPMSAEVFDPGSGTFVATGGLITERAAHTATLLSDGRVLVAGGLDTNGTPLATAELYTNSGR